MRDPMPEGDLRDRYAGIVLWLENPVPNSKAYRDWLMAQIDAKIHVAVFTTFGTQMDADLANKLDLETVAGAPSNGKLDVDSYDP